MLGLFGELQALEHVCDRLVKRGQGEDSFHGKEPHSAGQAYWTLLLSNMQFRKPMCIYSQVPDKRMWSVAQTALRLAGSFAYRNPIVPYPDRPSREPLR
jgi:hypothetical protein